MISSRARPAVAAFVLLSALVGVADACGGSDAASGAANDAGADGTAPIADGASGADAADASDAGALVDAPIDASAALALCDGIFGAAGRSFDSCCSPADKTRSAYQNTAGLFQVGLRWCGENLSRSFAHGRVRIDPTQAAACEAKIASELAANPMCWEQANSNRAEDLRARLGPAECTEAVVGQQGASKPCAFDYECEDGLTCVGWTDSTDGICRPPPAIGQPCAYSGNGAVTVWYPFGVHPLCASGAYCLETCQPVADEDAGCWRPQPSCLPGLECVASHCMSHGYSTDGGVCGWDFDCVDGLYCAMSAGDGGGSAGRCAPKTPAGSPCLPSGAAGGAQCFGTCETDGGDAGTCAAICGSQ